MQKAGSASDLGWLLDDLVHRVPHAHDAVVLSADGLLMASSEGMKQDDGEHLAAVAAASRAWPRAPGRGSAADPSGRRSSRCSRSSCW